MLETCTVYLNSIRQNTSRLVPVFLNHILTKLDFSRRIDWHCKRIHSSLEFEEWS
jgi:hypothetical protein